MCCIAEYATRVTWVYNDYHHALYGSNVYQHYRYGYVHDYYGCGFYNHGKDYPGDCDQVGILGVVVGCGM